jgi:hypothetical protein
MKRGLVWTGIILAATALDLGARFALGLEFELVLWIEALIFVVTSLVLYGLYRENPASPGWRRGLQLVLIASFLLAALRSAIWASGQTVTLANAMIFGLGVVALLCWRYGCRAQRVSRTEPDTDSDDSLQETARES